MIPTECRKRRTKTFSNGRQDRCMAVSASDGGQLISHTLTRYTSWDRISTRYPLSDDTPLT